MKVRLTRDEWYIAIPIPDNPHCGVECEVPDELLKRYWRTERAFSKAEAELHDILKATLDKQDEEGSKQ
jgi:hypothetical protein